MVTCEVVHTGIDHHQWYKPVLRRHCTTIDTADGLTAPRDLLIWASETTDTHQGVHFGTGRFTTRFPRDEYIRLRLSGRINNEDYSPAWLQILRNKRTKIVNVVYAFVTSIWNCMYFSTYQCFYRERLDMTVLRFFLFPGYIVYVVGLLFVCVSFCL